MRLRYAFAFCLMLAACGQTGPLVLPEPPPAAAPAPAPVIDLPGDSQDTEQDRK